MIGPWYSVVIILLLSLCKYTASGPSCPSGSAAVSLVHCLIFAVLLTLRVLNQWGASRPRLARGSRYFRIPAVDSTKDLAYENIIVNSTNVSSISPSKALCMEFCSRLQTFDPIMSGNAALCNPPWQNCLRRRFGTVTYTMLTIGLLAVATLYICLKSPSVDITQSVQTDLSEVKNKLEDLSQQFLTTSEIQRNVEKKLNQIVTLIPKLTEVTIKIRDDLSQDLSNRIQQILQTISQSHDHVNSLVQEHLTKYDADKTAMIDYALESAGGRVVSTRNTETYYKGDHVISLFGVPICQPSKTPQSIIQPGVLPGECWPFKGQTGSAIVQLIGPVHISGVSLEHIPKSLSPTGKIDSAPKDFSVWGLTNVDDQEGFFFGKFTYGIEREPLQYFSVQRKTHTPYLLVEMKVHSNHGNPEFTCVYRLRIHGELEQSSFGGLL
uniref:(California timema) hypothetical protein n=1 Tax=Timema californicum TaxID=61474 RepID=A0A7R9PC45_TIMCA|nr:unnamed protein product [Timema californicum]